MHLAYDTIADDEFTAKQFNAMSAEWIAEHRTALECPLCHNQAFFRKASVSGQAACFGARPHAEGCKNATQSSEEKERAEAIEKFIRENPGDHFNLRFTLPKPPANKIPVTGLPGGDEGNKAGKYVKWGKRQESSSSIQARQILINLATSEKYRQSTQTIATPKSGGKVQICDYFIPFLDASKGDAGKERGYWGTITDYRPKNDVYWVNTGTKDHMSICLPSAVKDDLLLAYGLDSLFDLVGNYVLWVGELRVAKSEKLYLKPEDARRFALYIPTED